MIPKPKRIVDKKLLKTYHDKKYQKEILAILKVGPEIAMSKVLAKTVLAGDCWEWTGTLSGNGGYGRIHVGDKDLRVHRLTYVLTNGPIPDGLVIDHICRNKRCSNPDHLRAVDVRTNSIENSVSFSAINAAKTACKNGHALTEDNTYVQKKTGFRYCRTCARARSLAYERRRREKRLALEAQGWAIRKDGKLQRARPYGETK